LPMPDPAPVMIATLPDELIYGSPAKRSPALIFAEGRTGKTRCD
jgi:hypothetical protein